MRMERRRYILAPKGLKVGDVIVSGPEADIKIGNALPLENIPVGTVIHNIELKPGKGGQLVRAAGTEAQLLGKEEQLCTRFVLTPVKCAKFLKFAAQQSVGR